MRWEKKGLIFSPDKSLWWQQSHASLPVAMKLSGSVYRVYFSSRDDKNRSHVGFFDVDFGDSFKILYVSKIPVLEPGPLGYFDDHGVYAASIVRYNGKVYMYYIGWNPGAKAPLFYSSIGLAVSDDEGRSFKKLQPHPIMARSKYDPCLVTSPFVLYENNKWRMWYVSGYKWSLNEQGVPQSFYHLKYAESDNGISFQPTGIICIDSEIAKEKNIARCSVIKTGDQYQMWFSSSCGAGYRISTAISTDGLVWTRKPCSGITLSHAGWDSMAQAYPFVVEHAGKLFMLYNGNQYGLDGVGVAYM